MNTKKYLLSVLAGFFGISVTFLVIDDIVFKNFQEKNFLQPIGASPENSLLFFVVPSSMALIIAYLYPKVYAGGSPIVEGFCFGGLLGLFSGIPYGVFFALLFRLGFVPVLAQILFYTLEAAAGGLIIGLVNGRIQPAESP